MIKSPYIVFRADGGSELGIGHIMRCLTLADRFNFIGFKILFISSPFERALQQKIIDRGFELRFIEENKGSDSEQCINILKNYFTKTLVVDHYSIDKSWEKQLKDSVGELVVIDDLANRDHDCDFLIDSAYGRSKRDYEKLVNASCKLLLSTDYIILRPEFSNMRSLALNKRENTTGINRILINFGGTDTLNLSIPCLKILKRVGFIGGIDILISSASSNLVELQSVCSNLSGVVLHVDSTNVAELMLNSDLAIGSLGTSTWERCSLGLPCISLVVAENQSNIAIQLDKYGAIELTTIQAVEDNVVSYIKSFNTEKWRLLSDKAFTLCDGDGVKNIMNSILYSEGASNSVTLEPMSIVDEKLLLSWQTEEGNRKFSRISQTPSENEHHIWFEKSLRKSSRRMWIVLYQGLKCGYVRLDDLGKSEEVSVLISKAFQGLGIAFSAINILKRLSLYNNIDAEVSEENIASSQLFKRLKFSKLAPTQYQWEKL